MTPVKHYRTRMRLSGDCAVMLMVLMGASRHFDYCHPIPVSTQEPLHSQWAVTERSTHCKTLWTKSKTGIMIPV